MSYDHTDRKWRKHLLDVLLKVRSKTSVSKELGLLTDANVNNRLNAMLRHYVQMDLTEAMKAPRETVYKLSTVWHEPPSKEELEEDTLERFYIHEQRVRSTQRELRKAHRKELS